MINVTWTLVYEIYFYLIFAATLPLRSDAATLVLSTCVIVAGYLCGNLLPTGSTRTFFLNPIALEFCFGLAIAFALSRAHSLRLPAWIAIPAAAALVAAPLYTFHADTGGIPGIARLVVWGLPATLIVASFTGIQGDTGIASSIAETLGDASYSIYLAHPFVMIAYARILKSVPGVADLNQLPIVPFVVLVAIALGVAGHKCVESPLLRALKSRSPAR
jgi:peptidoglycan/LPS O-acetylase OafA/YrhL